LALHENESPAPATIAAPPDAGTLEGEHGAGFRKYGLTLL